MFKWITYDGTTETLPPHVSEVLLMRDPIYGLKLCIASTFNEYAVKGWSWLPIPTPADCEKWEALREAAEDARDDLLNPMLHFKDGEVTADRITQALAALDAPKERDNA